VSDSPKPIDWQKWLAMQSTKMLENILLAGDSREWYTTMIAQEIQRRRSS
jgi:hypothetical protein